MKSNKQYEDKKRDCYELLSYLESNYKEQYDEILKIIGSSSDDGVHGFIICARNNALNIYHYGQSVAKIYLVEDKDNNKTPRYEVSDFFITGKKTGNKSTYKELSFGEFTKCYGTIIKNVVKNATGKRDDVEKQQVHRERICQQWIMNNCNKSKESDWYYIDMEYVDAIRPFGRFDMVAVRKTPKNGKHEVALVELKVTNGAYGTTLSTSKNLEKQKIIERKYDILKENLFAKDTDKEDYSMYELEKVKYGSGIVSHIADYLRYLNSGQYSLQLKQEIINAIKVYKKLGILPDDKLNDIDTLADLADKPTIYILSYTKAPFISNDKYSSLRSLKTSFYNQLYNDGRKNGSKYCLERLIDKKYYEEIWNIKDVLKKAIKDDTDNIIEIDQTVNNNNKYTFIIKFFEPDNCEREAWDCLE